MQLEALSPACLMPGTDTSQRFLASAHDAVEAVLETLVTVRELRREETGDIRGRLTANEEDLLRAAVVFTGAGLDATLKQLIRDTLPLLLGTSAQAHTKLETFATDQLGTGEIADTRMIARYLTSASPRDRLIEDYIYDLTGSSLQSAEEVQRIAGALGIEDQDLRKRIGRLKRLFVARNEISHELDLQRPERQGDRTRRSRAMGPTKDLCHEGLEVGQLIINGVGALL
jgi:hypothetical protein